MPQSKPKFELTIKNIMEYFIICNTSPLANIQALDRQK